MRNTQTSDHVPDLVDEITPDRYARKARRWVELGANIIGGCCGTTPAMIAATSALLGNQSTIVSD